MNVLRHAGIVAGDVETKPTQWLDMPSGDCFAFAEDGGMVETIVDLGDPVKEGDVVACVHQVGRTGTAPHEIRARMTGVLAARHFPGLIKAGDCAAVIAVEVD
jgi:N-alpha-acetyl-L-2,4-diaminobutyrate deacetylase